MIGERMMARVYEAAEREYPREACGWLAGEDVRCVDGGTEHGFAFGDAALVELARTDGVIAIFHSHPDGDVRLSEADVEGMRMLGGLPQLVVAVAGGRARAAALWRLDGDDVIELGAWER